MLAGVAGQLGLDCTATILPWWLVAVSPNGAREGLTPDKEPAALRGSLKRDSRHALAGLRSLEGLVIRGRWPRLPFRDTKPVPYC